MSKNNTKHLEILSASEFSSLYNQPHFKPSEQVEYFSLPPDARRIMANIAKHAAPFFILQWGYFRATHQFHRIDIATMKEDLKFILNHCLDTKKKFTELKPPSRPTLLKINQHIMELFNYNDVDALKRQNLSRKATQLVRQHCKPKIIFKELLKHIERNRWILPAYSVIQDLVGSAMSTEQERLCNRLDRLLAKKTITSLDALLTTEDQLYGITELQHDAKNFSCKAIKSEIKRRDRINLIYTAAKKILPRLKISKTNIAYYSSLASYYDVAKLKRMPKGIRYLYLLCYVYHRVQKINDNLIVSFIYKVSKAYEAAKEHGKRQFMLSHKDIAYEKEKLGIILGYFCENGLQRYQFRTISKRAYNLMPKALILKVSQMLRNENKRETAFRWDYFDSNSRVITTNIKPLFMAIDFYCDEVSHPILKATEYLKEFFKTNKPLSQCDTSKLPKMAIPKSLEPYLKDEDCINPYKYAFLVYYRLMKLLINNKVYMNDSLSFKAFSEDIKVTQDWDNKKEKLLKQLALPKLSTPFIKRLKEVETSLEEAYMRVNARISSGENKEVTVNPDGSWSLRYPKGNDDEFAPPFFRPLKQANINCVFDVVEEQCGFMRAFEHHLPRYNRKGMSYQLLKACIIANGTWQGTYNMAARSNLKFDALQRIEKARLQVKTIKAACDIINQAIEKQHHFHLRNTCSYGYHGSIDGSKHVTKRQTIQARYSSKYFGLMKGVVSLNMVVNEAPVNCDIIGANEYEGHYLYDLYHGNTSNIDPAILSTDTAGSNLINFLILDNIDVIYAPAYKSIYSRAKGLVGFKKASDYNGLLIKPSNEVPIDLILSHGSEIKQVLSALYLNETEQHVIVQKLCCRERQTNLKKALWAYNDILFSLHLLHYIDDTKYKKIIRKALNRGESYNRLFNSIVSVGNKKIRGLSEEETKVWDHCTRLLSLIIIYYNSYMLSQVVANRLAIGDPRGAKLLTKVSPMASRHINLSGNYHYSDEDTGLDLKEIFQKLNSILDEIL